jgi:hypothetical protein
VSRGGVMSPCELIHSLLHGVVCRVEVVPRSPSIVICVSVLVYVCMVFLGFGWRCLVPWSLAKRDQLLMYEKRSKN